MINLISSVTYSAYLDYYVGQAYFFHIKTGTVLFLRENC